jgi:hypothetical protein
MAKRPSWAVGRDVASDSIESYESDYDAPIQKRPSWVSGRGLDKRIIEFKRSLKNRPDGDINEVVNLLTRLFKNKERKAKINKINF